MNYYLEANYSNHWWMAMIALLNQQFSGGELVMVNQREPVVNQQEATMMAGNNASSNQQ